MYSIAKKKAAETKGKKKILPKIKTILADPYTVKCPSLNENELAELKTLLKTAIDGSAESPHSFATTKRIQIGLESSLRAIKNCRSSCVFLSLSIKPRHLISLLAANVRNIDKTVPVIVQPHLESFTEEIFGVRALCLVLPKPANELGVELENWIKLHEKPKEITTTKIPIQLQKIKKTKKRKNKNLPEITQRVVPVKTNIMKVQKQEKVSSGDYISFSNVSADMEIDKIELEEDMAYLNNTLNQMSKLAKREDKSAHYKELNTTKKVETFEIDNELECKSSTELDEFLHEYKPLAVRQVHPNPNKRSKTMRSKTKIKVKKTINKKKNI